MTDLNHRATNGAPRNKARGLLLIFIASFAVILTVALCAQLLMLQWRPWFPGAEGGKSLIGGVKSSVYTLMSHLI